MMENYCQDFISPHDVMFYKISSKMNENLIKSKLVDDCTGRSIIGLSGRVRVFCHPSSNGFVLYLPSPLVTAKTQIIDERF